MLAHGVVWVSYQKQCEKAHGETKLEILRRLRFDTMVDGWKILSNCCRRRQSSSQTLTDRGARWVIIEHGGVDSFLGELSIQGHSVVNGGATGMRVETVLA